MFDNRSPLMKKLADMMPPKVVRTPNPLEGIARIEYHPIRQSAEAFTHWLDGQLPADTGEMLALLWTFGELLCGQMEVQLNHAMRAQVDLLAKLPFSGAIAPGTDILAQVEAREKSYSDAISRGDLKEMERLAPRGKTYGEIVKPHSPEEEKRRIDAVNKARGAL